MLKSCCSSPLSQEQGRQSRTSSLAFGELRSPSLSSFRGHSFACPRLFSFPYHNHLVMLVVRWCESRADTPPPNKLSNRRVFLWGCLCWLFSSPYQYAESVMAIGARDCHTYPPLWHNKILLSVASFAVGYPIGFVGKIACCLYFLRHIKILNAWLG